eukprot:3202903-Rhodomonas_salina.1
MIYSILGVSLYAEKSHYLFGSFAKAMFTMFQVPTAPATPPPTMSTITITMSTTTSTPPLILIAMSQVPHTPLLTTILTSPCPV